MGKQQEADLFEIYQAGGVRRYHTRPVLGAVGQTTADHVGNMLALLFELWSEAGHEAPPSIALVEAITYHDASEYVAGDLPFQFKRDYPSLAEEHERAAAAAAVEAGLRRVLALAPDEFAWLKFLDLLEARLFAKRHGAVDAHWLAHDRDLLLRALDLGVEAPVRRAIA
jgi:hypothetical protein